MRRRAAGVGEGALVPHVRQAQGAGAQAAEGRLGPVAGGRDHGHARAGALVQRRAQGQVELVVAVGVQLVDDHQRRRQAVDLRRVGGEDAQVPIRNAQLEVADHQPVRAFGEGARRLEQDARLIT